MTEEIALRLADIAASSGSLGDRARALLIELGQALHFDSAWIALADPAGPGYTSLASTALDARTERYLGGPSTAHDIEVTGADQVRPPLSPSDLPFPAEDLPTWAECLHPAGYHEALAVSLFGPGHRHIGFLALLSAGSTPPTDAVRSMLDGLTPVLAGAVDPMRSALVLASLVKHAVAGTVLVDDGSTVRIPGFLDDPLLSADSALLGAARRILRIDRLHAVFLWPKREEHGDPSHVRVTVLAAPDDLGTGFAGMVLLAPSGPTHGLTGRELEVLGLVIDGHTNRAIADELVVTPRTIAAHLEHILMKLDAPSRTLAAVRAERMGLYVPVAPHAR